MIMMLRDLIKLANNNGTKLRVYKPRPKIGIPAPNSQEYDYCITGKDEIGRDIKMGGTAEWLHDELLKRLTDYF